MESENFYVLLDLDPSVDDWAIIEAAILDKRRKWALQKNQGDPTSRRKAEQRLKLIPSMQTMLKDTNQRRAIAAEARKQRAAVAGAALKQLDDYIAKWFGGHQTISPKEVKALTNEVPGVSEAEVVARLKVRGIAVADAAKSSERKERPTLEGAIVKQIDELLKAVGNKDLYDFLGLPFRSSPKSLYDAGDELYKEIRRQGRTDASSTARQELAGHCKAVFKDGAQKQRYDNTRADAALKALDPHLKIAAARDGFIDASEIEKLVSEAKQLAGVERARALEYIEDQAKKHKWGMQRDDVGAAARIPLCGPCNLPAKTPTATNCHSCGQLYVQPCPSCGRGVPTENASCAHCGYSTGDADRVQGLLREGKELVLQGEFAAAIAAFDRALLLWPNWKPAQDERHKADEQRRRREGSIDAVNALVRARRLMEAQAAIERLAREFGPSGMQDLAARIRAGISSSEAAFKAAELLRQSGRGEDAVDKFSEALEHCADFDPALRALRSTPPPIPISLQVSIAGSTAQLSWQSEKGRGAISFHVRRKAGSAPANASDGTAVCETSATSCQDANVPSGSAWYYAAFALRGDVASPRGAISGPHVVLLPVTGASAEASNGQVTLRWKRPHGATAIRVWRTEGQAQPGPGKGTPILVSGDSVVDQSLVNETAYTYRVVAFFDDPAGKGPLEGPSVQVVATPVAPPKEIKDLRALRNGQSVSLEWTPLARGDVQIRQSRRAIDGPSGQIVPLSSADQFGTPARIVSSGSAQATLSGQGRVYFVPLSIVAQTAVVGVPVAVTTLEEVTDLRSQRQGDTISLTWEWPKGAEAAVVAWDHDAFASEPERARGGSQKLTLSEYKRLGFWELRKAARQRHYFTVFVHDAVSNIHSAGAQLIEASGMEVQVRYRVVTKRGLLRRNLQEAWVELQCEGLPALPAVQAVLKHGQPPLRPTDGQIVASLDEVAFRNGAARIDLPLTGAGGFVKLFFKDGQHAREIRLLPAERAQLVLE